MTYFRKDRRWIGCGEEVGGSKSRVSLLISGRIGGPAAEAVRNRRCCRELFQECADMAAAFRKAAKSRQREHRERSQVGSHRPH